MQPIVSLAERIHAQALEISTRYKRTEAELIDIFQQVEEHRVFIQRGHSSLFNYVVEELGLGENTAYSLITVARKAREVPKLKAQLQAGAMTISNARRVASVLTRANQDEWLKKASELSNRELEKEIVKVRPEAATRERASYVTPDRVKLELGLSESEMLKLRRAQDLLSQAKRRPVTLEETVEELTGEFLQRHDPVQKAKRHQVRKGSCMEVAEGKDKTAIERSPASEHSSDQVGKLVTLRTPIPNATIHQVNLRDQRRCCYTLPDGARCNQTRWIEIHHKIPIYQGGSNAIENLITLCSGHHMLMHLG